MFTGAVNPRRHARFIVLLLMYSNLLGAGQGMAAQKDVATVSAFSGPVKVVRPSGTQPAEKGLALTESDQLETGPGGVVQVKFQDGSSFTLYEKSSIKIDHYKRSSASGRGLSESAFDVIQGKLKFFVNPNAKDKGTTQFRSKTAIMGIRGTSGVIDVAPSGATQLVVTTGLVEVKNPKIPQMSVAVAPNFSTVVDSATAAPQPPKPVSKEAIQNLVPNVGSEAGFTEDGPASSQTASPIPGENSKGAGEESKQDKQDGTPEDKKAQEGVNSAPGDKKEDSAQVNGSDKQNDSNTTPEAEKNQSSSASKASEGKSEASSSTPPSENKSEGVSSQPPAERKSEGNPASSNVGNAADSTPQQNNSNGVENRSDSQAQTDKNQAGRPAQATKPQTAESSTTTGQPRADRKPEPRPAVAVKPVFAPGGEVTNKPSVSNLPAASSANNGMMNQGKQPTAEKAPIAGRTDSAPGVKDIGLPGATGSNSIPTVDVNQQMQRVTNIGKELERVTNTVQNSIAKTQEVVQETVRQEIQTKPTVPVSQRIKVNISLPRD